ncbi:hypothetical protein GCM10019016_074020 [Streptomyces prasinosporus]|uniref:Uncharacterized protein n=1 Tax=Streptomyces prasinosporus TaxID=68256 RepID=A0ABP6U185_9ACTN
MTNELTTSDIANLIETEVQRRMNDFQEEQRKNNGQLTREELNGMSWQDIARARAEGRLNAIMFGRGE